MTEEEEALFYAEEFARFMSGRSGDQGGWVGPEQHVTANAPTVVRRLPYFREYLHPGARVLEIGCSSGFMLYSLAEMGAEVVGVDPSALFTDFVRARGFEVYRSLEELERRRPEPFDLVLHFFVLEHMREPLDFLRRTMRLLGRGGRSVFEVPSRDDPLITVYNISAFHRFYWSVAHHWYFDRRSLEFLLGLLGEPFALTPAQRYDLSNHLVWALEGRPGGQGRFREIFGPEVEEAYGRALCARGCCDTYFAAIVKTSGA